MERKEIVDMLNEMILDTIHNLDGLELMEAGHERAKERIKLNTQHDLLEYLYRKIK